MEKFNFKYQHLKYDEFIYQITINYKKSNEERLFEQIIGEAFANANRERLHKMRKAILDFNPIDIQIKSMMSNRFESIEDALSKLIE
ncbi:hypothetical protein G1K66_12470 [Tenacibaculum finnmarkense]|uniref:hypothetical protein n=1 Tax=Tenacibaculum finnmarkense TaxID=2781243 RepID=UPI001E476063|nr:hypothetical protein [Tenacibaculum finnmarkense]MCD8401368.1 hypothetical protein [Tenacibaculum finnmarkense genomovar ulcerans]MCG8814071.1 hypothetical protein [Tenacibaculum finnmarkense]